MITFRCRSASFFFCYSTGLSWRTRCICHEVVEHIPSPGMPPSLRLNLHLRRELDHLRKSAHYRLLIVDGCGIATATCENKWWDGIVLSSVYWNLGSVWRTATVTVCQNDALRSNVFHSSFWYTGSTRHRFSKRWNGNIYLFLSLSMETICFDKFVPNMAAWLPISTKCLLYHSYMYIHSR